MAACALVTCEVTICYGLVYEESVDEVTVRDVLVPDETIDKETVCDVLDHLANVDGRGFITGLSARLLELLGGLHARSVYVGESELGVCDGH